MGRFWLEGSTCGKRQFLFSYFLLSSFSLWHSFRQQLLNRTMSDNGKLSIAGLVGCEKGILHWCNVPFVSDSTLFLRLATNLTGYFVIPFSLTRPFFLRFATNLGYAFIYGSIWRNYFIITYNIIRKSSHAVICLTQPFLSNLQQTRAVCHSTSVLTRLFSYIRSYSNKNLLLLPLSDSTIHLRLATNGSSLSSTASLLDSTFLYDLQQGWEVFT